MEKEENDLGYLLLPEMLTILSIKLNGFQHEGILWHLGSQECSVVLHWKPIWSTVL